MSSYQKRDSFRNTDVLASDRQSESHPGRHAIRHIARRFGLSAHHAAVVAELAGLGTEPTR
jgi:hypothetical protein